MATREVNKSYFDKYEGDMFLSLWNKLKKWWKSFFPSDPKPGEVYRLNDDDPFNSTFAYIVEVKEGLVSYSLRINKYFSESDKSRADTSAKISIFLCLYRLAESDNV